MMMMMANQQRKFNKMPKASSATGRPTNLFANHTGNNRIGNNRIGGCRLVLLALCGLLLLLSAPQCANGLEELMAAEYGGGGANGMGGQLGSIATGSGRIFRPARSGAQQQQQQVQMVAVGELLVPMPMPMVAEEEENPNDGQAVVAQLQKRSMSLGRLAFRPGKRRFTPMAGAFAHDPHNHRYEFLFMDDQGLAAAAEGGAVPGNVESATGLTSASTKGLNNIRFRLLPTIIEPIDEEGIAAENNNNSALAEYAMGKRSSLASGRIGFRPAKRSMAVGRTGFRPGKRSIATGRVRFRPGKRSAAAAFPLLFPIQQLEEEEQMVPFITF